MTREEDVQTMMGRRGFRVRKRRPVLSKVLRELLRGFEERGICMHMLKVTMLGAYGPLMSAGPDVEDGVHAHSICNICMHDPAVAYVHDRVGEYLEACEKARANVNNN